MQKKESKGLGCGCFIVALILFPMCWPLLFILLLLGAFDD